MYYECALNGVNNQFVTEHAIVGGNSQFVAEHTTVGEVCGGT